MAGEGNLPRPREVSTIDKELQHTVSQVHRGRWYAIGVLGFFLLVAVVVLSVVVSDQQGELAQTRTALAQAQAALVRAHQQLDSSCAFYRNIALVPLATTPPPSAVGVTLLITARIAYVGEGCGSLPPPTATLKHFAQKYGIQVPV